MPGEQETTPAAAAEGTPTPPAANAEPTAKDQPAVTDAGVKAEEKKAEGKEEEKKAEGKEEEKVDAGDKMDKAEGKDPAVEVKTMKCVVLTGFGGSRMLREQQRPQPSPAQGQLLIRANVCGMSFQDLMIRQGIVENPPRTPLVMGWECAGVVEALGPDTEGFAVGDRVMALTDFNAWAELVVAPVTQVYKLPDSVSFEDGVCLLVHYITAYILLFDLANLHKGQSLLIHSAGGGVGQAILQLCDTVGDLTIFGTASLHKHEKIKDKVTHLFPHNLDYVQQIKKLSPQGLDIVLDCLCGEDTKRGISLLKPLGRYILYGSSNLVTGETKSFFSSAKSWWQVDKVSPIRLSEEGHMIGGFHLRRLLFRQGQQDYVRSIVDKLLELYAQGKIKPVIDSTWALEDVGEGMQKLQDRMNVGKVLLDPSKEPRTKVAVVEAAEVLGKSEENEVGGKSEENAGGKPEENAGGKPEDVEVKDSQKETTETPAADAQ